jgi:hypothetical protein
MKLRKIFKAPLYASMWVKAQDLASKKNYAEAMSILHKMYSLFDQVIPSMEIPLDSNILSAIVASGLGDASLALSCSKMAIIQLGNPNIKYSSEDVDYLRYFCRTIMDYCANKLGSSAFEESLRVGVRFRDLNFNRVRSDLRGKFPIESALPSDLE